MIPDPTTEIKRLRHQLGADMAFDLDRIFDQLQRQQKVSSHTYVRRPSRKPLANKTMHGSGGGSVVSSGGSTPAAP